MTDLDPSAGGRPVIVYGTRGSDLALTQTRHVAETVAAATGAGYRLEIIRTRGDAIVDRPLPEVGGKGLFTAELEQALREGRIDVAVHSLKDLPVEDPDGLTLGAVPPRAPVHDVLVYDPRHADPEGGTLPIGDGLRVGTSSPRRARAIQSLRKDLAIADVRGNVPTRADKVRRGDYAAVVLAAAGLGRLALDLAGLARAELPTDRFVPAPGQGALGVQCRRDDRRVLDLLAAIHDPVTARCVTAERSVLARLEGGCSTPLGALCEPLAGGFRLRVGLYNQHGAPAHRVLFEQTGTDPDALAAAAVERLAPLAAEPLRGRSVCLVRPGGSDVELAAWLAVAGAAVDAVALTEALPITPDARSLEAALGCDTFLVTSARSVDRLFEEAALAGVDLRERRFFAVGPRTAHALADRGAAASVPAVPGGGAELAAHVLAQLGDAGPQRFAFPRATDVQPALAERLTAAGHAIVHLPLYRIEPLHGVEWPGAAADAIVWTSPSSVAAGTALGDVPTARAHVAIGATTAAALERHGLRPVHTAPTPVPAAVLATVAGALGDPANPSPTR
ncbi:MAG: hydroxymethylbilane synthase [Planctomycetes bacterium]|nr:hydroxymethylbilane synthase [Planctomycetota bacterium]